MRRGSIGRAEQQGKSAPSNSASSSALGKKQRVAAKLCVGGGGRRTGIQVFSHRLAIVSAGSLREDLTAPGAIKSTRKARQVSGQCRTCAHRPTNTTALLTRTRGPDDAT